MKPRFTRVGCVATTLLLSALCLSDEARKIGMARPGRVWEREVLLRCDGEPVVFAHTVVPLSDSASDWPLFGHLGERSLGSTLFYDPLVRRGGLEFARLRAGHPLVQRAHAALGAAGDTVYYARRCLYRRHQGTLLVTEECLLSKVQERNPGLDRPGYEQVFRDWLGIDRTIWLGEGCVGDDTHGHIDDIARFVSADTIVLAVESDPTDAENHERSMDNLRRLQGGGAPPLRIIQLPFPRPVLMNGHRLPASYANFYIANGVVVVPTYDPPRDEAALATLSDVCPGRRIVGIDCTDLVWGLGAFHCVTQQWPA